MAQGIEDDFPRFLQVASDIVYRSSSLRFLQSESFDSSLLRLVSDCLTSPVQKRGRIPFPPLLLSAQDVCDLYTLPAHHVVPRRSISLEELKAGLYLYGHAIGRVLVERHRVRLNATCSLQGSSGPYCPLVARNKLTCADKQTEFRLVIQYVCTFCWNLRRGGCS